MDQTKSILLPRAKDRRNRDRPTILFVAMQNSPHTARWIETIGGEGWDLSLFPVDQNGVNPNLCGATVFMPQLSPPRKEDIRALPVPPSAGTRVPPARIAPFQVSLDEIGGVNALTSATRASGMPDLQVSPFHSPEVLAALIRKLKPDLIHSMEFQHAGYLTLQARNIIGNDFPAWLATNWGSDIFYFRHFDHHRAAIMDMLDKIDFYSCECHRDIFLAQELGYKGPVMTVLPNTGGFDIEHVKRLSSGIIPSKRRRIMVKGYQHFAGRAMVALDVLETLSEHLTDYEIILYSVSSEPLARAQELIRRGKLNIKIVGWATHDEMLTMFGTSRMYLGVSISDAISTSVLESMAMGAFPIQTNTSCCDEWFTHGVGGFIIPPDDAAQIRQAVLSALTDDQLVDNAAAVNADVVRRRLDHQTLIPRVIGFYEPIFQKLKIGIRSYESLSR